MSKQRNISILSAPAKPDEVSVECDRSCRVEWEEPNDHGAEITHYEIVIKEIIEKDDGEVKTILF